eukprot:29326-Pelagococcus_subviridis.AAC.4
MRSRLSSSHARESGRRGRGVRTVVSQRAHAVHRRDAHARGDPSRDARSPRSARGPGTHTPTDDRSDRPSDVAL